MKLQWRASASFPKNPIPLNEGICLNANKDLKYLLRSDWGRRSLHGGSFLKKSVPARVLVSREFSSWCLAFGFLRLDI